MRGLARRWRCRSAAAILSLACCAGGALSAPAADPAPASTAPATTQSATRPALPPAHCIAENLGKCPDTAKNIAISPDGLHLAVSTGDQDDARVLRDGKEGPKFDEIVHGSLIYSSDGKHLVYVGVRDHKHYVVFDGKIGSAYDWVIGPSVCFSSDSKHLAYIVQSNDKCIAYLDDKPQQAFFEIEPTSFMFSPDGNHLAYAASNGKDWFIVIDGKPQPDPLAPGATPAPPSPANVDNIVHGTLTYSPDSKHLAYAISAQGQQYMVLDGRADRPWQFITQGSVVFSPDSSRLAYQVKVGDKVMAVIDGKPSEAVDDMRLRVLFSPDSKHTAFLARNNSKLQVFYDLKPGPAYDWIGAPSMQFSPDSRHFGYAAGKGKSFFIVMDDRPGPSFDEISLFGPIFSLAGDHMAYVARKEKKDFFVVDEKFGLGYDEISNAPLDSTFSPDGRHFACCISNNGSRYVALDRQRGHAFDSVRAPSFSSDSQSLAYVGMIGAASHHQSVVVLDGRAGPACDVVMVDKPLFSAVSPEPMVEYLALRGGILYRIKQSPH